MSQENPNQQSNSQPESGQPENQETKNLSFEEKILPFQLEYAARIWEGKTPAPDWGDRGKSFEWVLDAVTDVGSKIADAFEKHIGGISEDQDAYMHYYDGVLGKIKEEYENNPEAWTGSIDSIIQNELVNVPVDLPSHEPRGPGRAREGAIRYIIGPAGETFEGNGILETDEILLLHFDHIDPTSNSSSQDSLRKLAAEIIKNHPNIKAIVADSWLMDTGIAKAMGFSTHDIAEHLHGKPFWGQFYDKYGNIKDDEMKVFLETGKAKYKLKGGVMMIETFLEKYGPKND